MNLVKLLRRLQTENTLKVTKTLFFIHKGICLYIRIRPLYDGGAKNNKEMKLLFRNIDD